VFHLETAAIYTSSSVFHILKSQIIFIHHYVLLSICIVGRCSGSSAHDYCGHACVQHQERDREWC